MTASHKEGKASNKSKQNINKHPIEKLTQSHHVAKRASMQSL